METELQRCDPVLLSCITADEILFWLPFIFFAFAAIVIWKFIRHEIRKTAHGPVTRGTKPGEGYSTHTVTQNLRGSDGRVVTETYTMRHTKDPNKHAQAMMPASARKKDKT